jgi:hypothetical protein
MDTNYIQVSLPLEVWEKVLQRLRRGRFETVAQVIFRMTYQINAYDAARQALELSHRLRNMPEPASDGSVPIMLPESEWIVVRAHALIGSPITFRMSQWREKLRGYFNAWGISHA